MSSIVIEQTGEVVETFTRVEAERITQRIADKLDSIADNYEQVVPLIREALTRGAHEALGYPSVQAYVSERFAGAFGRLPREVRRPVVAELSALGMSTRAIAPIVGVSDRHVRREVATGGTYVPPVAAPVAAPTEPAPAPPAPAASRTVVGLDGKPYPTAVPPRTPQRPALTKTSLSLGLDLERLNKRLRAIGADDRFNGHKEEMAPHLRSHLADAIEVCQDLLDRLTN